MRCFSNSVLNVIVIATFLQPPAVVYILFNCPSCLILFSLLYHVVATSVQHLWIDSSNSLHHVVYYTDATTNAVFIRKLIIILLHYMLPLLPRYNVHIIAITSYKKLLKIRYNSITNAIDFTFFSAAV